MDFRVDLSKLDIKALNTIDSDLQALLEYHKPRDNKLIQLMWTKFQEKVKAEIIQRVESLKGNVK